MKKNALGLIFTYKNSVAGMAKNGSLSREIGYYSLLANSLDQVYWFSYGAYDKKYQSKLPKSIIIIPKPGYIPNLIYSLLLPLIQRKYIRKCTVIKTNQILGAWTAQIAGLLYKKPIYLRSGYTNSLSFIGKPSIKNSVRNCFERLVYKYFSHASVTTQLQRDHLINRYNLDPDKISVIPNGIDTSQFKPSSHNIKNSKQITLLYVGRLNPEKNVDQVIKLTHNLNAQTTIIGNGPLEQDLKEYAQKIQAKATFINKIKNNVLPQYYNQTNYYIQLSSYEGNPKTILEALSCGCIVIATNVRGINEVIKDGVNGILVGNYNEAAEHINNLSKNKKLQEKIRKNARYTILQNYDIQSTIKQEMYVINKMI